MKKVICNEHTILDMETGLVFSKNPRDGITAYSLHGSGEDGDYVTIENGRLFWRHLLLEVDGNYSKEKENE